MNWRESCKPHLEVPGWRLAPVVLGVGDRLAMADSSAEMVKTAAAPTRFRRRELIAVGVLIALGLVAAVFTVLGMDPANAQQESDFKLFYFPTMQQFAAGPIAAIPDYNAAPTPLYFMIQGGVLALLTDAMFVRLVSVVIGAGVAWAVWNFPVSLSRRLVALSVLAISPYFRGQVWYSNGDVFALLLMLVALRPQGAKGRGWMGGMLMASLTVYVRQSFVFLPGYTFVKGWFKDRWPKAPLLLIAAVTAIPMIGLLALWHGLAPPRYAGHLSFGDMPATLGTGLTITAVYLLPIILMRALKPKRLVADVLSLPIWLHVGVLGAAAVYIAMPQLFDRMQGGGLIYLASQAFGKITHLPWALAFAPAFVAACYAIAITTRGDIWRNVIVLLATLSMSISVLIYQRYFDPLIPLLLLLHVRRPETRLMEKRGLLWLMALPPAFIALTAALTH
jgi:hypothetical protein